MSHLVQLTSEAGVAYFGLLSCDTPASFSLTLLASDGSKAWSVLGQGKPKGADQDDWVEFVVERLLAEPSSPPKPIVKPKADLSGSLLLRKTIVNTVAWAPLLQKIRWRREKVGANVILDLPACADKGAAIEHVLRAFAVQAKAATAAHARAHKSLERAEQQTQDTLGLLAELKKRTELEEGMFTKFAALSSAKTEQVNKLKAAQEEEVASLQGAACTVANHPEATEIPEVTQQNYSDVTEGDDAAYGAATDAEEEAEDADEASQSSWTAGPDQASVAAAVAALQALLTELQKGEPFTPAATRSLEQSLTAVLTCNLEELNPSLYTALATKAAQLGWSYRRGRFLSEKVDAGVLRLMARQTEHAIKSGTPTAAPIPMEADPAPPPAAPVLAGASSAGVPAERLAELISKGKPRAAAKRRR